MEVELVRLLLFKSSFATLHQEHGGVSVFTGVGERTREGMDLYHEMKESGVLKNHACFGQMNEPPGNRLRVAF